MKRLFLNGIILLMSLSCIGCQMEKRQVGQKKSGQKVDIIRVEQRQETDYSILVEELLNLTMEEYKKKGGTIVTEKGTSDNGECTIERIEYADKENELTVVHAVDDPYCTAHSGSYYYKGENAGRAYQDTMEDYGMVDLFHPNRLRVDYPKEEITGCSKEEAIAECQKLAKATGYENSIVNVYAMTVDALNRNYKANGGVGMGRPTKYSIDENPEGFLKNQKEWTEEYEAMYLVYQPIVNDVEIDAESGTHSLEIIYSPKYKRIVYASWQYPFQDGTVEKEEEIVSEDTAKQTVALAVGIKDEKNIVYDNIQLANAVTINDTRLSEEHLLVPVWRVDYHLLNSAEYKGNDAYKTALVNAVTGKMCQLTVED